MEQIRSHDDLPEINLPFSSMDEMSGARVLKSVVSSRRMTDASESRRTKVAKFQCDICGNTFTTKSNLKCEIPFSET